MCIKSRIVKARGQTEDLNPRTGWGECILEADLMLPLHLKSMVRITVAKTNFVGQELLLANELMNDFHTNILNFLLYWLSIMNIIYKYETVCTLRVCEFQNMHSDSLWVSAKWNQE